MSENAVLYPVHVSVDVRDLATLAVYWKSQGQNLRSLSEVIRLSTEAVVELLVDNGFVEKVVDPTVADAILKQERLTTKGMKTRGRASLLRHLQANELGAASFGTGNLIRKRDVKKGPTHEDFLEVGRQVLDGKVNVLSELAKIAKQNLSDSKDAAQAATALLDRNAVEGEGGDDTSNP